MELLWDGETKVCSNGLGHMAKKNFLILNVINWFIFGNGVITPEPLYNTVRYNTILNITRIRVGPQMSI